MKITREQFVEELAALEDGKNNFNVESEDSGSVYLALYGCKIEPTLEVQFMVLSGRHSVLERPLSAAERPPIFN